MNRGRRKRISSFTQLDAWREAHKLVVMIYRVVNNFPTKERYRLEDQIIRAAISISSNIAEGFGRAGKKDKTRFYQVAKASLIEVQNQLLIARDVGYLSNRLFRQLANQSVIVSKLMSVLLKEEIG